MKTHALMWVQTICICAHFILTGCARNPGDSRETLHIAAAADLQFVMQELITQFKQDHPQWNIEVSYGSSGQFYAQLMNRAPFDIFFSADMRYPRALAEAGYADINELFPYAVGRIVVWALKDTPIDLADLEIKALLHPAAAKVAIANPRHAPYGVAAEEAMRNLGLYDEVAPRLVFGENIAQAAQFIESGAADIGIIALSLAIAPALAEQGVYWEIPLEYFPRMDQAGIILPWAHPREAADAFRAYVLSDTGRAVLRAYGFYMPGDF
jgi:molybdate transport system substrate-binding protein